MDTTILPELGALGVGGILAAVVFMWKRADDKRYADRLQEAREDADRRTDMVIEAMKANTTALLELTAALQSQERVEATLERLERQILAKKDSV